MRSPVQRQAALNRRHVVSKDFNFSSIVNEADFQNLIQHLRNAVELVESTNEKLLLQDQIHSDRTIDTDQTSVQRDTS